MNMTSKLIKMTLEKRTHMGKEAGSVLRKEGSIPIEIYGKGFDNIHAKVNEKDFVKIIHKNQAGIHAIFEVDIEGEKIHTVIQDYQINALTDRFMHVDMKPINMNEKITTKVSVKLVGLAPAIKKGGIMVHNLHEIELQALPADIPFYIEADISTLLNFHESLHVSDLKIDENVVTTASDDTLVCHIEAKRGVKDDDLEEGESAEGEKSEGNDVETSAAKSGSSEGKSEENKEKEG